MSVQLPPPELELLDELLELLLEEELELDEDELLEEELELELLLDELDELEDELLLDEDELLLEPPQGVNVWLLPVHWLCETQLMFCSHPQPLVAWQQTGTLPPYQLQLPHRLHCPPLLEELELLLEEELLDELEELEEELELLELDEELEELLDDELVPIVVPQLRTISLT